MPKKKYDGPNRRAGAADRRKEQQKSHTVPGFGGTTPHYYRKDATGKLIRVPGLKKLQSFADQRYGPKDRRKKKE